MADDVIIQSKEVIFEMRQIMLCPFIIVSIQTCDVVADLLLC